MRAYLRSLVASTPSRTVVGLGVFAMLVACGEAAGSGVGVTGPDGASMSAGGASSSGSAGATAAGGTPGNGATDAGATGIDAGGHRTGSAGSGGGGVVPARDGAVSASDGAANTSYVCSLILGIATTNEWFGGFEKVVDGARWELKFQDSAHLEKWADPANAVWALPITSPCKENADEPDRIVFMGTNYDYDTVDLFLPKYVAVLNNVKAKYPTVRHLDVMTYTRAPGNQECVGANRSSYSYIKPAQDEAIATFAAMHPGFVVAAPRWEVKACTDFGLCPHLSGPANAVVSRTIGEYFLSN